MSAEISVSDHALIRWLQRVHGMDMEYFRRELAKIAQGGAQAGPLYHHTPDCTFVYHGNVLVTVLEREMSVHAAIKKKRRLDIARKKACLRDERDYEREMGAAL